MAHDTYGSWANRIVVEVQPHLDVEFGDGLAVFGRGDGSIGMRPVKSGELPDLIVEAHHSEHPWAAAAGQVLLSHLDGLHTDVPEHEAAVYWRRTSSKLSIHKGGDGKLVGFIGHWEYAFAESNEHLVNNGIFLVPVSTTIKTIQEVMPTNPEEHDIVIVVNPSNSKTTVRLVLDPERSWTNVTVAPGKSASRRPARRTRAVSFRCGLPAARMPSVHLAITAGTPVSAEGSSTMSPGLGPAARSAV